MSICIRFRLFLPQIVDVNKHFKTAIIFGNEKEMRSENEKKQKQNLNVTSLF